MVWPHKLFVSPDQHTNSSKTNHIKTMCGYTLLTVNKAAVQQHITPTWPKDSPGPGCEWLSDGKCWILHTTDSELKLLEWGETSSRLNHRSSCLEVLLQDTDRGSAIFNYLNWLQHYIGFTAPMWNGGVSKDWCGCIGYVSREAHTLSIIYVPPDCRAEQAFRAAV